MLPLLIPLAMAAIGAMADKHHPLRGAAIGGSLGFGGAGLLGAAGAAGAGSAAAGSSAGLLGGGAAGGGTMAGLAGLSSSVIPEGVAFAPATAAEMGSMGVSAGSSGLLGTAMQYAKPIGQAANAASSLTGLLGSHRQPIQPSPMPMGATAGSQTLGQLATQYDQSAQQQLMAADQARRQRRMGLLGGGYAGLA